MDTLTTQKVIDELMNTFPEQHWSSRQRYILEQTLHNLVRLAKVEQVMEMKASVKTLTSALSPHLGDASKKLTHRH